MEPLRLRRIIDPHSGRALLLSFTAGMEVGVTPDLADLPGMIGAMAAERRLTAAVVRAGVLPSLFARCPGLQCGTVVDLLGGTWLTPQLERPAQVSSLENAVRAGADGVLVTVGLGGPDESARLRLAGQMARDCAAWGMPLIVRVETLALPAQRQYSAVMSGQGARMAYELGADLVIVNYSGLPGTFAEAMHGIDIPVLVGGGPNMGTDEALLESVALALQNGASGAAFAAPLFWQDGSSTPALGQLSDLIFGTRQKAA